MHDIALHCIALHCSSTNPLPFTLYCCLFQLAQCLAQCPVRTGAELLDGLLCAATLLEYSFAAKRVVPEAMAFLASTLNLFSGGGGGGGGGGDGGDGGGGGGDLGPLLPTFHQPALRWLLPAATAWSQAEAEGEGEGADTEVPMMTLRSPPAAAQR